MNIRRRIIIGLSILLAHLIIGTVGYWILGGDLLDAMYMTVITAATVGYGEVIDLSANTGGRIFTIVFIIMGIITIAAISALLVASILEIELTGFLRRRKMDKEISKLSNHYIICGCGETGVHIAQELAKTLHSFVIIECDPERLERLTTSIPGLLYIKGDATEDDTLIAAGIKRAAGVIAALPSDKDNLYITVMTRQYNKTARVVALGVEDKALGKLKQAGADVVVSPATIGGLRMASEMVRPSVVKFLDTMLRQTTSTIRIEEITLEAGSTVINKKLAQIPLKDKFGLLILAIMQPNAKEIIYSPPADTVLGKGFTIVVMGEVQNIHRAREFIKG